MLLKMNSKRVHCLFLALHKNKAKENNVRQVVLPLPGVVLLLAFCAKSHRVYICRDQ